MSTLNTAAALVVLGIRQATGASPWLVVFTLVPLLVSLGFTLWGLYSVSTRESAEANKTILALSMSFFAFGLVVAFLIFSGQALVQTIQAGE